MTHTIQHERLAFISVSYDKRKDADDAIQKIVSVLADLGIKANVFVDNYDFALDEEDEMMQISCHDIAQSDFVIAEVSHKAVGLGVEVGYAIGLGKPVIYLRHADAEHSKTVAGISSYKIIYETLEDIDKQLREIIKQL